MRRGTNAKAMYLVFLSIEATKSEAVRKFGLKLIHYDELEVLMAFGCHF